MSYHVICRVLLTSLIVDAGSVGGRDRATYVDPHHRLLVQGAEDQDTGTTAWGNDNDNNENRNSNKEKKEKRGYVSIDGKWYMTLDR